MQLSLEKLESDQRIANGSVLVIIPDDQILAGSQLATVADQYAQIAQELYDTSDCVEKGKDIVVCIPFNDKWLVLKNGWSAALAVQYHMSLVQEEDARARREREKAKEAAST